MSKKRNAHFHDQFALLYPHETGRAVVVGNGTESPIPGVIFVALYKLPAQASECIDDLVLLLGVLVNQITLGCVGDFEI